MAEFSPPATSKDVTLQTRWLLEQMERDQNERREWHCEAMTAYNKRGDGISGLMTGWLVTRTIVELAIFVALVWR